MSLTQVWLMATFLFMAQLPELLTVAEVAEVLRLSDETVHRWCRTGRLEYVDIVGVKRFRRDYIQDLLTTAAKPDAGAA
jgi:excisionase family DNA binding protein